MSGDLQPVFLDTRPDLLDQLAGLHAREWGHLYEDWDLSRARAELLSHRSDGRLPATLILADAGLIGSVSVIQDDLPSRPDLNPWLASLLVVPDRRGRGHAVTLISAAIDLCRRAGIPDLYLFTEDKQPLFAKLGFVAFDEAPAHGHTVTLMRLSFPSCAGAIHLPARSMGVDPRSRCGPPE